jgi:hypothetical protein
VRCRHAGEWRLFDPGASRLKLNDRLSPARVIAAAEILLQRRPDVPAAAPAAS